MKSFWHLSENSRNALLFRALLVQSKRTRKNCSIFFPFRVFILFFNSTFPYSSTYDERIMWKEKDKMTLNKSLLCRSMPLVSITRFHSTLQLAYFSEEPASYRMRHLSFVLSLSYKVNYFGSGFAKMGTE